MTYHCIDCGCLSDTDPALSVACPSCNETIGSPCKWGIVAHDVRRYIADSRSKQRGCKVTNEPHIFAPGPGDQRDLLDKGEIAKVVAIIAVLVGSALIVLSYAT